MITKQYLRLILFDIDGTLITTNGLPREAFSEAIEETLNVKSIARTHDFAGKTDQQIWAEIVRASSLPEEYIEAHADRVFDCFFRKLEERLHVDNITVLPGVRAILDALRAEDAATTALLTGNMLRGARIKLTPPALLDYFAFGAFGNDASDRPDLPEIAVARAYDRTGVTFKAKDIVIIGDTPHDIDCGRHLNVRSIAVATGGYTHETLAEAKPDFLFDDLTDIDRLLSAIFD